MENNKFAIEVSGVNRIFPIPGGEFQALTDINVQIPTGSLAVLKGRSGSGKTTLMNIIGALDYPTSGKVLIDGEDIVSMNDQKREDLRRTHVGFVFQFYNLVQNNTSPKSLSALETYQARRKQIAMMKAATMYSVKGA